MERKEKSAREEGTRESSARKSGADTAEGLARFVNILFPDTMRKALLFGVGSMVMTEEAIRKYLSDLKMPGDVIQAVVQQSRRSKNDIIRVVSEEVKNIAAQAQVANELRNFLGSIRINIQMEIDFQPKEGEPRAITVTAGMARKEGTKKAKGETLRKKAPAAVEEKGPDAEG
jgi:galactitol-specific phosphotransferase system IIB component